jgi:hypothetical protein
MDEGSLEWKAAEARVQANIIESWIDQSAGGNFRFGWSSDGAAACKGRLASIRFLADIAERLHQAANSAHHYHPKVIEFLTSLGLDVGQRAEFTVEAHVESNRNKAFDLLVNAYRGQAVADRMVSTRGGDRQAVRDMAAELVKRALALDPRLMTDAGEEIEWLAMAHAGWWRLLRNEDGTVNDEMEAKRKAFYRKRAAAEVEDFDLLKLFVAVSGMSGREIEELVRTSSGPAVAQMADYVEKVKANQGCRWLGYGSAVLTDKRVTTDGGLIHYVGRRTGDGDGECDEPVVVG